MIYRLCLLCLVVWAGNSRAQDTTQTHHGSIKIRKQYVEADYWPRISNTFSGEISRAELCHPKGIYTVYPMRIISFEMKSSYIKDGAGIVSNSNKLTDEMCRLIRAFPDRSVVYFENITAIDPTGKTVRLNSLRYILRKSEETAD